MNFRHQVAEERDSLGALRGSPKPTKDASGESTPADNHMTGRGGNFLGGAVVKNPPANAGDMSSIPGLVRSYCRATKPVHHHY